MIKLCSFVDIAVERDVCTACLWGDCFVRDWEPFRQPIVGQFGVIFGATIIESATLPGEIKL
jgi:hypothetical protein